jgi:hypothetical protein
MITLEFAMFCVNSFFLIWILYTMKEIERHASLWKRESIILLSEQSFRLMEIEETLKRLEMEKAHE